MSIISFIGPKGGIGKTTLAINTTAALTRALGSTQKDHPICLVDLDLRLPTISSLLNSHPPKTFYDLFESLANKTWQVDFLRNLYQTFTGFRNFLEGEVPETDPRLLKQFAHYKTVKTELFQYDAYPFGDLLYEIFLKRGEVHTLSQIRSLDPLLSQFDLKNLRALLMKADDGSRPHPEVYVNYIEEYGFSMIGGEVPILGKRGHRKRINEPEFLLLFLEFLRELFEGYDHIVLDTPAGGVNHLSSLICQIDLVQFVFDLSNTLAINGSIDALHTFIDYYEDFNIDYNRGHLTGLEKAYIDKAVAKDGKAAVYHSMKNKKLGLVFNRCEDPKQIPPALNRLREYLDTLDKFQQYKKRIYIVGMVPQSKVVNITNNRGVLFYNMDGKLAASMDQVAQSVLTGYESCPTLEDDDKTILQYLDRGKKSKGLWPVKDKG